MARNSSRRTFLKATALTGVGVWVAGSSVAQESKSPNEKIRFACIGIGGKGESDSADAGKHGDVVAIVDIDEDRLNKSGDNKFKSAKRYTDYRKMFDEMEKQFDAITVSTPDHHHAFAAVRGIKAGKHAFVQKPLTHSISEARLLGELAREHKVASQMGNQGTAGAALREAAAICKSGALGAIKEVHVWTNRPVWPSGNDRPKEEPVPSGINWDAFIGPAPMRPYGKGYHPFAWRGWWDFGTGALGDMACHTFNMPFMGLNLRDPVSVEATHSGHNKDSFPKWAIIKFQFPELNGRAAIPVTWYDGGKLPSKEVVGEEPSKTGALIVGEKGKIYSPGDYCGDYRLIGLDKPKVEFPKSPGHFEEYVRAIKGGEPAMSNFPDYAGPLSETILLGNLAVWCGSKVDADGKVVSEGKKVEWDAKTMKPTNAPELELIVKRPYREGWSL